MNNKTPKDWIEVHKEKGKKEAQKRKASDVAYNPIPSMYKTFDSIALAAKDKSKETKVKMWGTSERFPDFKKSKSSKNKTFETPGPGAHNMIAHWPGKQDKKAKGEKPDKKDWMKGITKGVYTSIYYS